TDRGPNRIPVLERERRSRITKRLRCLWLRGRRRCGGSRRGHELPRRHRWYARLDHLAGRRGKVRLRPNASDNFFDLPVWFTGCFGEKLDMVVGSEMRRQDARAREVQLPCADGVDDRRQAPRRACHVNAVVSRVLRKSELGDAEGKHRGKRAFEVQLAFVHLSKVDEKVPFDETRLPSE